MLFYISGSPRKSLKIFLSNKQSNDMQKGVYIASMTYRFTAIQWYFYKSECSALSHHKWWLCTLLLIIITCKGSFVGIFWINFRPEDNKIHTMPRKFKLSISIVTSAILTMFISDPCASVVLVALKGLP